MTKSKMANRYSPEVRARAVRMVFEHQGSYETQAGVNGGVKFGHCGGAKVGQFGASALERAALI